MARKVFFSFHYGRDLWRVNIVRNTGLIEGFAVAGFHDASLWEETKRKSRDAIRLLIDKELEGTSVTAVLIGAETANSEWVSYEIERSADLKKGILGIRINSIKDEFGKTDLPGPIPAALLKIGAPIYDWEYGNLGRWVDEACKSAKS